MNIYEQINNNRWATWVIVIIFILFFLFIGIGFDYYWGLGINLPVFTMGVFLFSLISISWGYRYGDRFILSSTRARELDLNDPKQRQWQNVIEEMSIASGIPKPKT